MSMEHVQFITGHYLNNGNVRLCYRDKENRRGSIEVAGFRPHFYVNSNEIPDDNRILEITDFDYKDVYGTPLRKITVQDPTDVGGKSTSLREEFPQHWQADINFIKLLLIKCKIKDKMSFPSGSRIIHHEDLHPGEFSHPPLINFLDIETYSSKKFPDVDNPQDKITAATIWDYQYEMYCTLLLSDKDSVIQKSDNWTIYTYKSEKDLIWSLERYYETLIPDVGAEWNKFDFSYLKGRAKKLEIEMRVFQSVCLFDMLAAYKRTYKKSFNRLKDMALTEGLTDTMEEEVDYAEMYDNDPMGLAERNKRHVEWMVELDKKKRGMVDFFWGMKSIAGLGGLDNTLYQGVLVDTLLLRGYDGKWILPSKPKKFVREKKAGGVVGEAPHGLFKDVVIYDFSRYYPNIMIGKLEAMNEPWLQPIIDLCYFLLDEREKYEKILDTLTPGSDEHNSYKNVRNAVKFIGEAVIGYFGDEKSRLYNKEIFEMVTIPGQAGIRYLEKAVEDLGYRALYYDTDGIFCQVPKKDWFKVLEKLNIAMKQFSIDENINREITLKIDRAANRAIFLGVKKRYALHVVWEDGKDVDYLHIKGFEYIRRDASLITKEVQQKVMDTILRENTDGLIDYLRNIINRMKSGEYSLHELAIPKNLSRAFDSYKVKPQTLKGIEYMNEYFGTEIKQGEQVRMLYVKRIPNYPKTDVICFQDEHDLPKLKIDYDHFVEKSIKDKIEDFLDVVGISWSEIKGTPKLSEAWF